MAEFRGTETNDDVPKNGIDRKPVIKQYLKKILRTHPNGIWAEEFPSIYEEFTGEKLALSWLGFLNVIELVDALPEIFMKHQPIGCKTDWLLFPAGTSTEKFTLRAPKELDSRALTVNSIGKVIVNTRKILQMSPGGVFLNDFIHIYCINCEDVLQISDFGYEDLQHFLLSIAECVPLTLDYTNARTKVLFVPDTTFDPTVPKSRIPNTRIPSDVVLPGAKYVSQTLPPNLDVTRYFPILIGTFATPDRFWIQLQGVETSQALNKLMNTMDDLYYGQQGDLYKMEENHIKVGTICAGTWLDNHWHRICIVYISVDYVDAVFVDYGTKEKVPKNELRYLKQEYLKLPTQAINAKLAFIKPRNSHTWDPSLKARFLRLTTNVTLMAYLIETPSYEGFLSLWLCRIMGEEDIHLTKLLVTEGFAEYTDETCKRLNLSQPAIVDPQYYTPKVPEFTPATTLNESGQTDVVQAVSTILQFQAAAATLSGNQTLINSLIHALNLGNMDMTDFNSDAARQALLSNNKNIQQHHHSNASKQIPTNNASSSSSQNFPPPRPSTSQKCFQRPPINLENIGTSLSMVNSIENGARVMDANNEAMNDIACKNPGSQSQEGFVKRINLGGGYRIHIIMVADQPYVSEGDVFNLFWSQYDPCSLSYMLCKKGIDTYVITEVDYPRLFEEFRSIQVKGVRYRHNYGTIALYPLKIVIDILDIVEHPSATIRDAIEKEINSFEFPTIN